MLQRYEHLEAIPADPADWDVPVRGAAALAANLERHREDALLFRRLATLRTDVPIAETLDDLRWRGPAPELQGLCDELGYRRFLRRFGG